MIKTEAGFIAHGVIEGMVGWKWRQFRNKDGSHLINADLFIQIEEEITRLDKQGVEVSFWHVRYGEGDGATALAMGALNRYERQLGRQPSTFFSTFFSTVRR